eukprot:scaffold55000_cov35-Tisochrysis_lutea.AAC.2
MVRGVGIPAGNTSGRPKPRARGATSRVDPHALYCSASDVSKESKRVTVTGQDVIKALKELEFDDLVEHMEVCLAAFRETEKARALAARAKKAKTSGESTGVQDGAEDADEEADVADGEDGEAPADDEDGEDIEDDEGAETELEGEDLEGARVGTGEEAEQE